MKCEEVKGLIQLYQDNELDARSTLAVQHHLESCSGCLHLLNSFIDQDRRLRQAALEETVDSGRLREKILDAIGSEAPSTHGSLRRRTRPAIRRAAAIAAILLAVSFLLFRGRLFQHIDQQVYAAAASDHIKCTTGARMGEIADADELKRLTARLGKMRSIPDLTRFGYGPPSATLCRIKDEEFLHLIFNHPGGRPISVYLKLRTSELIAKNPTSMSLDGYHISSISQSGVDLLIVSSLDEAGTASVIQAIARQINPNVADRN